MTGGEDDGGSPAPGNSPEVSPVKFEGVDLYTQAIKALSERSPFDSAELVAKTSPTLPSVLASVLWKQPDSRRKHKRGSGEAKSSRKSNEKSKKANVWGDLDGYFSELDLMDVERLSRLSSLFNDVASFNSCFTIPVFGNAARNTHNNNDNDNGNKKDNGNGNNDNASGNAIDNDCKNAENDHVRDVILIEDDVPVVNVGKEEGVHNEKDDVLDTRDVEVKEDERRDNLSVSCSSIEWVLGSRNRVLLTTTRPTKKRKLLGENAGLERLMVAQPCEGSTSLCHVCSIGDTGDSLNQLVVCRSCKVVVHQKCYGVQGEVNESWMCSFCKYKSGNASSSVGPCVLCPKLGGASKRFQRAGGEGSTEFAHLFCCQWMPEVHIGDTRMMEPVLSVEGIKDIRAKLVCNLCKIKLGSCVRCSDGSCRTSFHPICAREARNKLEIWGKFGCDDIELRAFCGKHSGDSSVVGSGTVDNELRDTFGGDSLDISVQQGNKIKKLKISCKNGDRVMTNIGVPDANTKPSEENASQDVMPKDIKSIAGLNTGSGYLQKLHEAPVQKLVQDKTQYFDLGVVLKKLLDRGKVSLEQIASEFSITEDSLATKLAGNHLGPEMSCKILKWLGDHAYMDTSEKDVRAKDRRMLPPKAELLSDDHSEAVAVIDVDMPDVVPVKSVPPRRRTVGNIVKEEKVTTSCNDKLLGNDDSVKEANEQEQLKGDHYDSSKDAFPDGREKILVETNGFEHPPEEPSPAPESIFFKSASPFDTRSNVAEEVDPPGKRSLLDLDQELPSCSINNVGYFEGDFKPGADSFVHPYIKKKLEEVQSLLVNEAPPECNGWTQVKSSAMVNSPIINGEQRYEVKLGDLRTAKEMGILDLSPENEVEGEIIFSQQRLLCNAVALKHQADQLVCKVVRRLPDEMDAVRKQRWDDVLVNQYIYDLKEARKQSRKERRHKEAQAVLAAATAAAASSTRVTSLRKDAVDESSQQENQLKMESSRIRGGLSLLAVPRPKELNSSCDDPKAMTDGYPDMFQYNSGSPKEHLKTCDICRRTESLLNPMIICLSCKVAVHLNCYRSVKESTGPWYCELCEESSSFKASRSTLEKPYPIAECGLCGASNGAFRKSTNGQWVHAICAEWVFDSTFRRGQVSLVAGMETVVKGNDICSVCHRRFGVCIKCNYCNCQTTFHPSCARSAGYYMHSKYVGGGKMQYKAYCSKHSMEQKGKAETQKHGAEDLKIVKQHRVELEKLRLLCERIVKREKLKRELVLCNYDILASRRESLPLSILARRPFVPHEVSSESATTSLKGHSRSCSEAMQKSDDVTIDSTVSSKRCIRLPLSIDHDLKADDGSTSQRICTPKPIERTPFAGKQIPVRATTTRRNSSQSAEKMSKSKKNTETVKNETLMTSDQASSRNSRLPKGYIYVPVDTLANEKQVGHDSTEKEDVDG